MLFLLSAEIESVMVSVIMESVSYAIITLNAYSEWHYANYAYSYLCSVPSLSP